MGKIHDFVIVGSGIVGLTVANELSNRFPDAKIAVLEKEPRPGMHASGRNSGVMHSGIYYASDTLKARVCASGGKRMLEFAKSENIACSECGKIILATEEEQLSTLDKLIKNARKNNIPAERIDHQQLREIEPFAAPGPGAIFCPTTAVIDSAAVVKRLWDMLDQRGVKFHFEAQVTGLADTNRLETTRGSITFGFLYNCAGAYADIVARMFGLADEYALIPFKGIYWKLSNAANHKVKANIYPVPDISLPFLGVHLTRVVNGEVYIGPTAIPALGRENYERYHGVNFAEAGRIGLSLASMYLRDVNNFRKVTRIEISKYFKNNFLSAARKLLPSLSGDDMVPTRKAGIRPQLINTKTKKLELDYILRRTDNSLHVLNAISPAFTSSFEFAKLIVDELKF